MNNDSPAVYDGAESRYVNFEHLIESDPDLFEEDEAAELFAAASALAESLHVPILGDRVPMFVWRMSLNLY